jgi:molybdate transport system regulatory protein
LRIETTHPSGTVTSITQGESHGRRQRRAGRRTGHPSSITREAVTDLEFTEGSKVIVLVKSTEVEIR